MNRQSQRNRIYALLKENEWRRVSLSTILDLRIANYRARISDLRREGHTITCEKQRQDDGSIHSWYTLNPVEVNPLFTQPISISCTAVSSPAQTFLFGGDQ